MIDIRIMLLLFFYLADLRTQNAAAFRSSECFFRFFDSLPTVVVFLLMFVWNIKLQVHMKYLYMTVYVGYQNYVLAFESC